MANSIAHGSYYSPRPFPTDAIDQCDASPNALNSYPPPHGSQQPLAGYIDPLQLQGDPRYVYSSPDPRHTYNHRQPNPSAGHPHYYPHPAPGYGRVYYPLGMECNSKAVRQRNSMACRQCRKRKIRCSRILDLPSGPICKSCAARNSECIFEPVSRTGRTRFIPTAVSPGGMPSETQLIGAYGQPLFSSTPAHPSHLRGPALDLLPQPDANCYDMQARSPAKAFSYFEGPKEDPGGSRKGKWHTAGPGCDTMAEDRDKEYKLPLQAAVVEVNNRQTSPVEHSNSNFLPGNGIDEQMLNRLN